MGVEAAAGETPSLTGEFFGETHRGLEHAQAHLGITTRGPNLIVDSGGSDEIWWRVEQAPLLPLGPSPTYSITAQRPALPYPAEHLSLRPLK